MGTWESSLPQKPQSSGHLHAGSWLWEGSQIPPLDIAAKVLLKPEGKGENY